MTEILLFYIQKNSGMLCFYPKTTGKLLGTMNFSGRIFQRFTNRMVYVKIQLRPFRSGGSSAVKSEKR